jgi:hypothetical protein
MIPPQGKKPQIGRNKTTSPDKAILANASFLREISLFKRPV